uniref:Uncharacterized LOC100182670 n=2 Tax=Ciona intestinalis TaxID=7719 RepID=F6V1P3_CIOIN
MFEVIFNCLLFFVILTGCDVTKGGRNVTLDCASQRPVSCERKIFVRQNRGVLVSPTKSRLDHSCCWSGNWVDVTSQRLGETSVGNETLMTCFNMDERKVEKVSMKFMAQVIEGREVAWFKAKLKPSADYKVVSCKQHLYNGSTHEDRTTLLVKFPPLFLRHVIKFNVMIGRMNAIDIPVFSHPANMRRRNVRIQKQGLNFTHFYLRHTGRNRQDIVMHFPQLSINDVGNYSVVIHTSHHVVSTVVILNPSNKDEGVNENHVIIIVISCLCVVLVVMVVLCCFYGSKPRCRIRSSSSNGASLVGLNIDVAESTGVGDDVFLPVPPRSKKQSLKSLKRETIDQSKFDSEVTYMNDDVGNDDVDEDGYLQPIRINEHDYVAFDDGQRHQATTPPAPSRTNQDETQFTYENF